MCGHTILGLREGLTALPSAVVKRDTKTYAALFYFGSQMLHCLPLLS